MTPKRRVFSVLTKSELLEIAEKLGVEASPRTSVEKLRDELAKSRTAPLDRALPLFSHDALKSACQALGLVTEGRTNQVLIDRLLSAADPKGPKKQGVTTQTELPIAGAPERVEPAATGAEPVIAARPRALAENEITIEVQPRKPRLAWQGMWRVPAVTPVPTQVVEIVRPARAQARRAELELDTRVATERDLEEVPPNRLIWTNDNLAGC